jgi:hypothetical protein
VYRACVVNYGNRLVLEVLLPAPGARYKARDKDLPETTYPPVPPSELGIESFEDILPENLAELSAHYPSPELTLPPAPRRVSGIARGGLPLELNLPEGYVATSLWVGYVLLPGQGSLVIEGVAGHTPVSLDVSATGVTRSDMQREEGTVRVVLQTTGPFASPPVELEPAQLTVDVEAEPSEHTLDAWRLRTYQAIQNTYASQLQKYLAPQEAGVNQEAPQPRLSPRAVIRRELQQQTIDLLFQEMAEHLGPSPLLPSSGGPSMGLLAHPRYLRFFDRAFEWSEMSYSFLGGSGSSVGARGLATLTATSEECFHDFLAASYAQLLLPVRPDDVLAVLYFLQSGMLWDGPAMWTAVHAGDEALALELKQLSQHPHAEQESKSWEVLVPTSISVLQEGTGTLEELRFHGALETREDKS